MAAPTKKKVTFPIPADYQVPEGVTDGQTFDESVTLKLEGKNLCLVAVNGVAMPGYDEEQKGGEKAEKTSDAGPDPGDFQARYAAAMAGGGGQ